MRAVNAVAVDVIRAEREMMMVGVMHAVETTSSSHGCEVR